jgi:hypothetical protein
MEKLKRVTGLWRGIYSFDASERLPQRAPVSFTLNLKQGWFGRFKGSVTDDPASGMPGTGVIFGRLSFPRIAFIKQMPVCCVAVPGGSMITLREYLIGNGYHCEKDPPHSPILYEGEFSSPSLAQGTWVIRAGQRSLPDGRALKTLETKGSWSMEACAG